MGFYSKNKKILSIEFFLDISVILRKILRIFVNTGPDHRMFLNSKTFWCKAKKEKEFQSFESGNE